jgi:hypothetical protein
MAAGETRPPFLFYTIHFLEISLGARELTALHLN